MLQEPGAVAWLQRAGPVQPGEEGDGAAGGPGGGTPPLQPHGGPEGQRRGTPIYSFVSWFCTMGPALISSDRLRWVR